MKLRAGLFLLASCVSLFAEHSAAAEYGYSDGITAGIASGWVIDSALPSAPVSVHFYAVGADGISRYIGAATTAVFRPDVNQAFGVSGNHGFDFPIPFSLRDGTSYQLYGFAVGSSGAPQLLSLYPASFSLPPPMGYVDSYPNNLIGTAGWSGQEESNLVTGWALDPVNSNQPVTVLFYADGSKDTGTPIGSVQTGLPRADVNLQSSREFRFFFLHPRVPSRRELA